MENTIALTYFKTTQSGKGICADDLKLKNEEVLLNMLYFVSLSPLQLFRMPFTGNGVDYYSVLTMLNGDAYYIGKKEFIRVSELLKTEK